jgi:hypothetical protein
LLKVTISQFFRLATSQSTAGKAYCLSRKRDSKTGPKKGNVAVTPPFLERVPYTRSHDSSVKNLKKIEIGAATSRLASKGNRSPQGYSQLLGRDDQRTRNGCALMVILIPGLLVAPIVLIPRGSVIYGESIR